MSVNAQFGAGVLFGTPNAGNIVANPTPQQFSILQEISVEIKGDLKKLYGQQQAPVAKARGKLDITAKGKIASINPGFLAQLYFGQATASGVDRPVFGEAITAAASVAPSETTADKDLGVTVASPGTLTNVVVGQALTRITTGTPTTGQYKFTQGVAGTTPVSAEYVFAVADVTAGLTVLANYTWPDPKGTTLHITNQSMGFAPEFEAVLYNNFRGQLFGLRLYSCVMGSLSIPTKQEDFWVSDFDLDASCDISGNLLDIISDAA
jgi:hypothetical protein